MYHLVSNLTNKGGDALVGYYVKLKDSEGAYATLYSDANSTPISTVSGVADAAVTDDEGMYDIYVADGDYDIEFFDKNDISLLLRRIPSVPMYSNTSVEAAKDATLADLASTTADKGAALVAFEGGGTVQEIATATTDKGAALVGFLQSGTGASARTAQAKLQELVSVVDFGADPTGTDDSTAAFVAAIAAGHSAIHVPKGTFKVGNIGGLHNAGLRIIGDSRYTTEILVATGTTGSIFYHPTTGDVGVQTAYGIGFSDLFFNLNGQNVTAIDFGGINSSTVRRVRFTGGTSLGTATGVGVRCAAPDDAGAYNNKIVDCDATYMARAFVAEDAANENTFDNCEAIVSTIGFDVEAGVDTARIIGGRAEGCTTGLRTGGRETIVVGCRFEANATADVEFVAGSERPSFVGCYTATSTTVFLNESNSTGLLSRGGTFPQRDNEPSTSNPILSAARRTFAPAGVTPATSGGGTDYATFTQGYALYAYTASIEFENYNAGTPDNRVLAMNIDTDGRVAIPGYDRKSGTYTRVYIGPNFNFNPNGGLEYAGIKVLGAQQAAITNHASDATVNAILAALRAHGLIASS